MPLNASKLAHIQTVIQKAWASRQKTVVFVMLSGGTYSYTAVSVIFRPQQVINPQILATSGGKPLPQFDMMLIAPLGTNFQVVFYVSDTATATSVAVVSVQKYEVIEVLPVGMAPGGSHMRVLLRRLR